MENTHKYLRIIKSIVDGNVIITDLETGKVTVIPMDRS